MSNSKLNLLALALLGAAPTASAHMQMTYPPPFRSKSNPHTGDAVDYSMTSPLRTDGSDFPCKGYLSLLGTPQGQSVASWTTGGTYNFTISGGAAHGGGSCQAALSVDGGATFRVMHSYEGGCPGQGESSFRFAVPRDVPAAQGAVFAWTWFNNLGNREMYMNCAAVDITAGAEGGGSETVAFASRPGLFVANVGNGCRTVDSANVKFPDPGPDVDSDGSSTPPTGSCGVAGSGSGGVDAPGSGSSGGSSGSSSDSPASNPGETSASSTSRTSPTQFLPSPSPVPPTTSAPSSPPSCDCRCATQPTAVQATVTDAAEKGWTPGNDWPAWFDSAAAPKAQSCSFVAAVLTAYAIALTLGPLI